jgi:hypothetical protein
MLISEHRERLDRALGKASMEVRNGAGREEVGKSSCL